MRFLRSKYLQSSLLLGILLVGLVIVPLSSLISPVSAAPSTVLTWKWTRSGLGTNWEGGLVIGDVTGDGREDVVCAGGSTIYVLNGATNGATIASYTNSRIYRYCQPQLYDVDGDGVLDILVPLFSSPGLAVVKYTGGPTLSLLWSVNVQGTSGSGSVMAKPVAGDIDGDGHLDIFIASQDVSPAYNFNNATGTPVPIPDGYDGTIVRLDYQGHILATNFAWRACSGGLSLADTDNDGTFELYQGDRGIYYGDGNYGRGARSFWADNLTIRWDRLDFLSSSQSPVIADVNGDGIKDVITGMYREMNILNSSNGQTIQRWSDNTMSVHYGFTVYDIDGDGHLELLCNDGDHDDDNFTDVYDLVTGQLKAELSLAGGDWKWSPLVADISPTHPGKEIICAPNGTTLNGWRGVLMIYDSNFQSIQNVTTSMSTQLGYPVVQDIDGDGYLELVVGASSGSMYAFDTAENAPAPSGSQRIRSEVTYFGECRLGVAEHTIMPGAPNYWTTPLVAPVSLSDNALKVPQSTTQLTFKIRDQQSAPITYTVTSYPDIGSTSGSNTSNSYNWGTYTLIFNKALAYDTTYTWTVAASDGTHVTRRTCTFRTALAPNAGNSVPTQLNPTIIAADGLGTTSSTFVCTNGSTTDLNGDNVTNIYRWSVNGQQVANLILPFNTRNETVTKDYSAYNNNGNVTGAVWTPNGIVGGAYSFDGKDDAIVISDGGAGYYDNKTHADYNPELGGDGTWNKISVEAWIYLTQYNNGSRIVAKLPSYELGFQSGYTNRLMASVWPQQFTVNYDDDNHASTDRAQTVTYTANIQLNTWYHVAFTYESGVGLKLYLNGALVAQRTGVSGPLENSLGEPVYIGRLVQPFAGKIDEVRIYPYTLSATQINNSYVATKGGLSTSSLFNLAGIVAPGATLSCDVIPTDSYGDGAPHSASITLLNSAPVASNLNVYPVRDRNTRLDNENLGVNYTYFDPDGQAETNSQISWYRNGVNQTSLYGKVAVPNANTQIGDQWYFNVTPRDSGGTLGTSQVSPTVTIRGNTAPSTGVPTLDSMNGGTDYDDEDLVATAAATTDGDSPPDATTNIFHWTQNGVSQTNLQMPFDTEVPSIPNTNGVTKDYSGYGNNGAVNGSAWVQDGVVGGALSFDGNDYVKVQENGNTLGGDGRWSQISVEFWIRATGATTSTQTVVFKPDSSYSPEASSYGMGYRVQYRYYTDSYRVYWIIGNDTTQLSLNSRVYVGPDQWHHVVCTYQSGVGLKIYTDGLLIASLAATGNINATLGGPLYIGGINSGQGDFIGQMDEVRIYPKALSWAQIFQRYIETKDGLSGNSTIVAQETSANDNWVCQVIPNDSWGDGTARNSPSLHVDPVSGNNSRPRIDWYSPANTSQTIAQGASMNFTQVSSDPNPSDILTYSWTLDSVPQVTTQNWTYVNAASGIHTVRVTVSDGSLSDFQEWSVNVTGPPTWYTLIIGVSGSGNTNPAQGTYQPTQYTNVTVQATPNPGESFNYWLLNNVNNGTANPYTLNMTKDYNLTAVFTATQYTLTVNTTGSGTVTRSPNQATYTWGTNVTLTAVHDAGWSFANWSGDATGSSLSTVVNMTSNKTVTATFTQDTYNLIVSTVGSGSVILNNSGPYHYGDIVGLTAVPAVDYDFINWSGDASGTSNTTTITMTGNKAVTATFGPTPPTPTSIFEDDFETGSMSKWNSTATSSSGETIAVGTEQAYDGTHSLKSTTNGNAVTEYARAIETLLPTQGEVYVRGYFKLTQNGIVDNSDRIKLIELRAGSTIIAAAGLYQSGGTLRWWIETRSGTTYVETYTTQIGSFDLTQWFSLELYWKLGSTDGSATLWINDNPVYQITNADTDNYGSCSALRFGLAELTNCGSTTLYSDSVVVAAAHIGPEGPPIQYTLHVEIVGSGITNATGDHMYNASTNVAVLATADPGWTLGYWLRNNTNLGSANPCQLTMGANYNLTVVFVEIVNYTLHVEIVGSGVTNATSNYSYNAGTNVAVSATADSGWTLDHWVLNGTDNGYANPYQLIMNANYNLTAVFNESTPTDIIFADGFESGSTSAWNGTVTANGGETAAASSEQAYDGTYSLKSTSNGGGGTESARANEVFSPTLSQIRVQGYFKLPQNGIAANGARIKLIELRAGSTVIAAAGIWQVSGTLRWWIETRSGTTYVETYTTQIGSFDLTQWFSLELYWKLGSTDGSATLKVNGNPIYQITNADTDNYGSCSALRFGLAELTNCGTTTLYSDYLIVSDV